MIKVEGLSKSFKKIDAITDLSFTVQSGEVLGLLGPNGAGKTTTLRSIAGVLRPQAGSITISEFNLFNQPIECKRLMAYLPDQPAFFDSLTCWEHIRFLANVHQVKNYENKAMELFQKFELQDKRNAFASELSKGMKQRLGIICSLIHSPKVLVFDEPMTGLDPKGIRTLNQTIREEAAKGAAIVLSSHLLSILEEVCTKVLVMNFGKCRLYGTLEEVRAKSSELKKDSSLEDMFFYATQEDKAS